MPLTSSVTGSSVAGSGTLTGGGRRSLLQLANATRANPAIRQSVSHSRRVNTVGSRVRIVSLAASSAASSVGSSGSIAVG